MMWAGISFDGKTELVFVPGGGRGGGLTSDRYISNILLEHVLTYAGYIGDHVLLMQDNARCHTARVTTVYLEEVGIATLDWPALSPDLTPIEHVWNEPKRKVRSRTSAPSCLNELKSALIEEWESIPQKSIQKLIRSMKNRLRAVIKAREGNTKY
ncbi:hypothetical protein F3H15_36910 [Pseudomonas aeruginosa]|nr:hypothetical protein F3H15_36910 [Pseudomonas aeruginosa]